MVRDDDLGLQETLGLVMLVVLTLAVEAWILVRLWMWFLVPLSPLVPELTYGAGCGVLLLVRFITADPDAAAERSLRTSPYKSFWRAASWWVVLYVLAWGLAGIIGAR